MTDMEIDRAVDDAKQTNEEFLSELITVKCLKISLHSITLDLAINLSSSTELEADTKHEENK